MAGALGTESQATWEFMVAASKTVRLLLEEFEETWQGGSPAEISTYVRQALQQASPPLSDQERRELIVGLIEVDLEYRWRMWQSQEGNATLWCLEGYESQVPEFVRDHGWPDELILAEYKNRRRFGDKPSREGFLARFARRRDSLLPRLSAVDAELAGANQGLPAIPELEMIAELGHGGFGVVYKAWQTKLARFVAVKMLSGVASRSENAVARFELEAQAIARLDHPNIVRIHQVGEHEGRPYLVLEFLEGGSLTHKLAHGKLSPKAAAAIVEQIAEGLEAAHTAEVIHRDLKPDNVLFDHAGTAKIVDFGLARLGDRLRTRSAEIMGTPAYMSPEQALGNTRAITAAADIYSLGVILYQLLAGRTPFVGTPHAILDQVIRSQPTPIRSLERSVPLDLATICDRCLERDPAARFATAAALRDELRRFQQGQPIASKPRGLLMRAVRWAQYQPVLATLYGTIAVALLLAAFAGLYFTKFREADFQRTQAQQARNEIAGEQKKTLTALKKEEVARRAEEKARQAETQARKRVENLSEEIERLGSLRQVAVAHNMWKENRLPQAKQLLQTCPERFRKWEWHYVWGLCQGGGVRLKHDGPVRHVAISSAGAVVATNSGKMIRLWNAENGQETQSIDPGPGQLESLEFSHNDAQLLALLGRGGATEVQTWEVGTGKPLATVKLVQGDGELIRTVSPDGERFITYQTARPNLLTIRNCNSGEALCSMTPKVAGGVRWVAGGKYILNWGLNGFVQVFNPSDCSQVSEIENRFRGISAAGANERFVVLGFGEGTISVWDLKSGKEIWTYKDGNQMIRSVSVSDKDHFVIGAVNGSVKVHDANLKKEVAAFRGHSGVVVTTAISSDGRRFVSGSQDGLAVVSPAPSRQESTEFKAHKGWGLRLGFSSDGKTLATSSIDRAVKLWKVGSWENTAVFQDHTEGINRAVLDAERDRLYAGCVDGSVHVWRVSDQMKESVLGKRNVAVMDLALVADRQLLIAAYLDGTIAVWDTKIQGDPIKTLKLGGKMLSVSRDGKQLAVFGETNVTIVDTELWKAVATLKHSPNSVESAAFLPDGERIATGASDDLIRIWDIESGKVLKTLAGHFADVASLQVLPQEDRLVSGSADKSVRLWDLESGQEIFVLGALEGAIEDLAVSPNGLSICAASDDGNVRVWAIDR